MTERILRHWRAKCGKSGQLEKNRTTVLLPLGEVKSKNVKETERGREEVCKIMENRITEEKIELAKNAIKSGELTLEQIAKVLDLSLPIVEELARTQAVGA